MSWLCECGSAMGCLSTRRQESGNTRRYECHQCGKRQTTIEIASSGSTSGEAYKVSDFREWHSNLTKEFQRLLDQLTSIKP